MFSEIRIYTIDIADIPDFMLQAAEYGNVTHFDNSAVILPLPDQSMGFVVSNFALDLMHPKAWQEMGRVLAPEGIGLFNFHYPHPAYGRLYEGWQADFWRFLQENHHRPFASEEQIVHDLKAIGLTIKDIQRAQFWEGVTGEYIGYWQVEAQKEISN